MNLIRLFTDRPELYNDWRWVWSGPWSAKSLSLLAALLGLALWFSWGASRRLQLRWQKFSLLAMRLVIAGALWFLVAGPSVELRHVQKIQNYLPIFFDTSASMLLKDEPKASSHIEKAKSFFKKNKDVLEKLKAEQKVRFFTFDRKVRSFPGELSQLQADGDQTNLLRVAHFLHEQFQDKPLAGAILVTDGIDTLALSEKRAGFAARKETEVRRKKRTSRRVRDFVRLMESLKVPIHLVVPRKNQIPKDIAVTNIYGDAFAFLHNTATIEARIRVQGVKSGQIPVTLYREGELLQSKMLLLQPDKSEYLVSFKFRPRKAGKFLFSVRLPLLSGESVVENNRKSFLLKIIRDRIRVLQVTGRPSWDVRFLRRLLKKNANIDLISFFILRTHLNPQNVPNSEMALIPFPSHELFTKKIYSFDLVIFHNFNSAPYMPAYYLENIRKFVRKGGAFVMVGGELSFGAGGYLKTSIEPILPVKLGLGQVSTKLFLPKLSKAGEHHPITRLFENPTRSKKAWQSFPKLPGLNLLGDPFPGAVTLLEHPTLKTDQGNPRPVLAVGEHGKGRSMALTIDSSWKWNFGHVGKGFTRGPYYRFWNNAIRWLIRDPELERIRVTAAHSSFRRGEIARFRVRVLDKNYQPRKSGKVRLSIYPATSKKKLLQVVKKLRSDGTVSLSWKSIKAGMYRLVAETEINTKNYSVGEELFEVRGLLDEFQKIRPNTALFAQLKQKTGGQTFSFSDSLKNLSLKPPTIVRINRSQTVDLWDRLYFLLLILALFSIEWIFRRRWGLP